MRSRFTKPYVDALFSVAGTPESVERLLPGLDELARTLHASAELRMVLQNPGVEKERKNAVLAALAARAGLEPLGARLLQTLLGNHRLAALDEVLGAVRERLDKDRRVVEAKIRSAVPLGDAARALADALAARGTGTVRLVNVVDPKLLGGFVVEIGSEVFDASLVNRLHRARRALHTAGASGAAAR